MLYQLTNVFLKSFLVIRPSAFFPIMVFIGVEVQSLAKEILY